MATTLRTVWLHTETFERVAREAARHEHDVDHAAERTTEQALSRLTRQSLTPFTQAPRQIAWRQKPATYLVCTEDLATPPEAQRQRIKAGTQLVEFGAGHHPLLSRPDEFADSIVAAIDRT